MQLSLVIVEGAIDLTIVPFPLSEQKPFKIKDQWDCSKGNYIPQRDNSLDMGSSYDCFHEISHTGSTIITPQQRANRLLLKSLMEKQDLEIIIKSGGTIILLMKLFQKLISTFQ